jgi:hypothetical protein
LKIKWKQTMMMLFSGVFLLIQLLPLHVMAQESPPIASQEVSYYLTGSIKAALKSVLNEQTTEEARIIAIVRLYNEGPRLTRIPDLEVRAKTVEGVQYTLLASSTNVIAIQPKETAELSYMISVNQGEVLSLSEIIWVEVDEYASPKMEKTIAAIPVSSIEWKGADAVFSDPAAYIKWGETFKIPVLSASLEYKTARLAQQNTLQGPMTIIELLVTNKSDMKESIPDFRIDGKSDKKVYAGNRLEQGTLILEPGEQRYIHYAIPASEKIKLKSLSILTPEIFAIDDNTKINYSIGQAAVLLPEESNPVRVMDQLGPYSWNHTIRLDPLNKIIQSNISISMSDLHMHESTVGGFKVAVAKFKLDNHSDRPMPVPRFQVDLMSTDGNKYTGTRQNTVVETLIPNISYVIYYSFVLPSTESGTQLAMEILDGETIAPYKIPIAMFKTQVQLQKAEEKTLQFYPFSVQLNNWAVDVFMGIGKDNTYRLKLDLAISLQDEVVVDQSFPKMKVVLVDSLGKIIGSQSLAFTGEKKVSSGMQTFNFNSELWEFTRSLRIYETIDTPFGEAERLVATLEQ